MVRRPVEVFGHPWNSNSQEAEKSRSTYYCPYIQSKCIKQSRLIDYPMGVCSVFYDSDILILCPNRFLQDMIVFNDVAMDYFGTIDNIVVLHEVGLTNFGSFDYVMVKHHPMSSKVVDFVIIEFQGYQTTQTGKLVDGFKDIMENPGNLREIYNFNLNSYDIVKRTLIQMLHKGKVAETWNQKIYWVMQEKLYNEFLSRYNLGYSDNLATNLPF